MGFIKSGGRTLGNRKTSICGRIEVFWRRKRASVGPLTPPLGAPRQATIPLPRVDTEGTYLLVHGPQKTLGEGEKGPGRLAP